MKIMDMTQIASAIVTLLTAIVTAFLIPYIQKKTNAAQRQTIATIVKTAVDAAEQIFSGTGLGQKKKEFVLNYLKDKGIIIDIDSVNSDIDMLIESFVYEMNKEKGDKNA